MESDPKGENVDHAHSLPTSVPLHSLDAFFDDSEDDDFRDEQEAAEYARDEPDEMESSSSADPLLTFLLQSAPHTSGREPLLESASGAGAELAKATLSKALALAMSRLHPYAADPMHPDREHHDAPGDEWPKFSSVSPAQRKHSRVGKQKTIGAHDSVQPPPHAVQRQAGGSGSGAKRRVVARPLLPAKAIYPTSASLTYKRPRTPKRPPPPPTSTAASEIGDCDWDDEAARIRSMLKELPPAEPSAEEPDPQGEDSAASPRLPPIYDTRGAATANAFFPEDRWDFSVATKQLLDSAVVCCNRKFDAWQGVTFDAPSPRGRRLRRADGRVFDVWTDESHAAFYSVGLHRPENRPRPAPLSVTLSPRSRKLKEQTTMLEASDPVALLAISAPPLRT